jgi:uroporphyrinogen decarboxylase
MGTTEFLTALKTEAGLTHRLLRLITDFLGDWHDLQRSTFPSIDGILVLDDIVGFIGEEDFLEFALPYLREIYATDAAVKFFHNDAPCASSVRYYPEIGINLFNPGMQTPLVELRSLAANRLTILGTIPPRDVLAQGTPEDVRSAVRHLLERTPDRSRLILSCAGGMPPGVTTGNIQAFISEANAITG